MLSIKEISQKFNISKSTLYGWEKERPEIFAYLQRADYKYEELRNLVIVLEKYAKTITPAFEFKEIEFILGLGFHATNMNNIENLHIIYSQAIVNHIKQKAAFVMPIYTKLERLNLIERYIFVNSCKEIAAKLPKMKKEEHNGLIMHYFRTFII
ncbi:MAG: helix-turn-helix domain-containing protein [Sulfurimonas sp.]|uniref:helix-turn-helix domain-containing protein n=1 Tax=Sulfurimonas sp. TaxID=2022749 RepID=UPI00260659E2|nr:helix-turn-helix domain-containing protein [Sulfurimonas sp.]MDD2652231.1 helix-turn-helix domain-containing protein [Sulfurimonas sp.]MDD3450487.1 helix-turn-helix domain-containing protein [Sulfurimonas sp.]